MRMLSFPELERDFKTTRFGSLYIKYKDLFNHSPDSRVNMSQIDICLSENILKLGGGLYCLVKIIVEILGDRELQILLLDLHLFYNKKGKCINFSLFW